MAVYCTIDDVKNRLSADGVTYRTDDLPPTLYGDVLDEASRIVDEYAFSQYGANLAASVIVKHWAANIAAYLLCERRGNPVPGGIASKYERVMDSLNKVMLNGRLIADIAQLKTAVPRLSSPRIRLDPYPRTVIERSRSTGETAGYNRKLDTLDYLDYVI